MSIDDLIADTLDVIRSQFYPDRVREYKRDERALMKAIARWGYECRSRGWDFDAQFIQHQMLELLNDVKRRGADIKYLPLYLEGAVGRWIDQRAEEWEKEQLRREAKGLGTKVAKIIKGVRGVQAVVEKTDTEILDRLYRDLRKKSKQRRRKAAKVTQPELL